MNSVHDPSHFTDFTDDMAFLSSEILSLRLRKSCRTSETLCLPNSPTKRNHKPTDRVNGVAKNVAVNVVIFGKVGKANGRWTADLRPMFLSNGVPSWTYSELSVLIVTGLTEYYVNQNGEITLPCSVPHKTLGTQSLHACKCLSIKSRVTFFQSVVTKSDD